MNKLVYEMFSVVELMQQGRTYPPDLYQDIIFPIKSFLNHRYLIGK